jgi:hypothetical protein
MKTVFIADVYGAGEALDNCDHARLALTQEDAKQLLVIRPAVEQLKSSLPAFLRVEAVGTSCRFGTYIRPEDEGDDDEESLIGGEYLGLDEARWYAEPDDYKFYPCPQQDVVVMRLNEEGVEWRMVPKDGDESPCTTTMKWEDVESLSKGEVPFPAAS